MLTESEEDVLARVIALLPQLDSRRLARVRRHTAVLLRRRTIVTVSKAGFDVHAGLLAAADVKATREAAQLGIAEIDDTPGAIAPDHVAYDEDRDEDGDPIHEQTPLVDVRPVLVNEIDAE